MSGRELRGVPAAPGIAVGVVRQLAAIAPSGERVAPEHRAAELDRARGALEEAARQLEALAGRLTAQGRADDAEIVATGALMGRDPSLDQAVGLFVLEGGLSAPDSILEASAAQADLLAAIPDPTLAARADDVRSLGRRAALLAAPQRGDPPVEGRGEILVPEGLRPPRRGGLEPGGRGDPAVEGRDEILVAEDLGPADVAELEQGVRGIALAGGGATAHAAIVARGLGLPLVAGLGSAALALESGELVVLDGAAGLVVASPSRERADAAREAVERSERARTRARSQRDLPAETVDGHRVTVLANVAGVAELELALEAGAEGIGLLRTELGFLDAAEWPSETDHDRLLAPILTALGSRPATVRVLDFGADKTPPFLAGEQRRGIELLLGMPDALRAQLRSILRARASADLRVLLPIVESQAELAATAQALAEEAAAVGAPL